MHQVLRRLGVVFAGTALIAVSIIPAGAGGRATDAPAPAQAEHDYVMVKLTDPPIASYTRGIPGLARTKPQLGGKLNLNSSSARAYSRYLAERRQNYRGWLQSNAPRAQIVREYAVVFNGFAIRLNGERLEHLATGPGASRVSRSFLVRPTMNVSTSLIGADVLWAGAPASAGLGVAVAIIDSGVQDGHPFFACKGSGGIPAIDHHGPYFSGVAPGAINPFPTIISTHGTHVAGTVGGCPTDLATADPDGPIVGTISGVAPGATLHDFNVFPGIGAGLVAFGGAAFSHDIAAAIEDAVLEGVDVINMSIGGGVQGPHDFLADASDAAVDAGVVVVAAAGNAGPGLSTVGSPGSGRKVIAAGASTNPHFIGIPVTVGSSTFGAALGDFASFGVVTANFTTTIPANGCTAISTPLTGKIALIDRGQCTFTTKIRNAQNAGAIGVLVVNNVAGDPIAMGHDGTSPFPTIPAAMLGKAEGNSIKPSGSVSVDGTSPSEVISANADIIAGFSSRGPTPFTFLIKPDAAAPGVNVYSSVFSFGPGGFGDVQYDFALFQGTSMATPHIAGSAALLRALHPDWSPADVRSALVNTAARTVRDHVNGTVDPGVLARGGGRIDLVAANDTPLTLDPASASFGRWTGNRSVSAQLQIAVRNVSGAAQSCGVSTTGPALTSASPGVLNLAAGATTTVTVNLNAGPADMTSSGDYDGDVSIDCGGALLRVPWWVRIDREAKP